jgi:hypothetical protein
VQSPPPPPPIPLLQLSEEMSIPQLMDFIKLRRENLQKLNFADAEIRLRIQKIKAEISEELSSL